MGYGKANGRWADTEDVTLATAAVVTATGVVTGSTLELGDRGTLRLSMTATAAAAANTTVEVQTSNASGDTWVSVAAFTAVTANGSQRKVFTGLDRFVRLNVTAAAGTVTLAVSGEAV